MNARIIILIGICCAVVSTTEAVPVKNNNDNGPGSLREAIMATGPGGTITFDDNVRGFIVLTTGQLNIGWDLNIVGPGARNLLISGNFNDRVFYITNGAYNVNISNLSIFYGSDAPTDRSARGGAIFNAGGLTMYACTLGFNNATAEGCGHGAGGGAILNEGLLVLDRCTVRNNLAIGNSCNGGVGAGGGIANGGTLFLVNCTFYENGAVGGDGNDSGAGTGGAIWNGIVDTGNDYLFGNVNMSSCTVISNYAFGGDGIRLTGGFGGGLSNPNGNDTPFSVFQTIIAGNFVRTGTGNSVSSPSEGPDVFGNFNNTLYNLIGKKDAGGGWDGDGDQGGSIAFPFEAYFDPDGLKNNGGPTDTIALRSGSYAIDHGGGVYVQQDQRGRPRGVGNGLQDIGAYELRLNFQDVRWLTQTVISYSLLLSFDSVLGATNFIQSRADLSSGSWSNLPVSIVGNGGVMEVILTNSPSLLKQFYRVAATVQTGSVRNVDFDSTVNPVYSNAWVSGSNVGRGFGPWTLRETSTNNSFVNGFFIGSSTNNGSGASPGIDVGGGLAVLSIVSNTTVVVSPSTSWGLYANSNNLAVAYRTFSNSVPVGGTVGIDMDNGYIGTNNSVGFVLRSGNVSSNATSYTTGARFQFEYVGFDSSNSYKVVDAGGLRNIGVPFTDTGLHLLFTLNTANTYTLLTINNASGATNTFSGTLAGSGTLTSIALFINNAGNNSDHDVYFNSLQIVGP